MILFRSRIAPKLRVLIVDFQQLVGPQIKSFIEDLGCECIGPLSIETEAQAALLSEKLDAAIIVLAPGRLSTTVLPDLFKNMNVPFGFAMGPSANRLDSRWSEHPYLGKPYSIDDVRDLLIELLPLAHVVSPSRAVVSPSVNAPWFQGP